MPVDVNRLCLGCMNTLPNARAACPRCGWSRQTSQNLAGQLPQGITLTNPLNARQYLIGKTIGQGGFGIVYTAWDIACDRKVAIKEYFTKQFVTRDNSNTVVLSSNSQSNKDFFDKQKKRFRQEAEKMQLFANSRNVVNIVDFFDANNTSYIVMEFVEGQTFAEILYGPIAPNHRLSLQTVLLNLKQVVGILEQMHKTPWTDDDGTIHHGIIHRDISPENIMYASDGTVKLLDFGSARVASPNDPTQVLKHGFAPYEQYLSVGAAAKQGSWTDVYAFAAMIYYAITGQLPAKSFDRANTNVDPLVLPSALGVQITPAQEQVLLKGLAVDYHNRYQSISQFYSDMLFSGGKDGGGGGGNRGGGGGVGPTVFTKKAIPELTVSSFNKNGNTYTATINYNGDGALTSSIGTINGNILSITSADGNFSGVVTASEGTNYSTVAFHFEHKASSSKKTSWAVAAVAVLIALVSLGNIQSNKNERVTLQNQISTERQKMEKYADFANEYGYASSSYYADRAIVFINKNSEAKVSIYCDLLKGTDSKAYWHLNDGEGKGLITVKWEDNFDKNHRANIIINSSNQTGYATIHFTNEVNADTFDVLVVVQ